MIGWFIAVYRQSNSGLLPATNTPHQGEKLARWQASLGGLDWIEKLVEEGKAIEVATNGGYPIRYTIPAKYLIPYLTVTPPNARENWIVDVEDVLIPSLWKGKTEINKKGIHKCDPDEWLLLEAWDES